MTNWKQINRIWHANLGMLSAVTLGLIAISCFTIAHKAGGGVGDVLKDIHTGKFLPGQYRWVWIDSQGLLLGWLILSGVMMHQRKKKERQSPQAAGGGMLILHGSQTGTAEAMAEDFAKQAEARGIRAFVQSMDQYDGEKLADERWVVAFVSTYGEGEFPDAAEDFWRKLSSPQAPTLRQTRFAVCALGDSNYEFFCEAGKKLDARLEELGARRFMERHDIDAQEGDDPAPWLEKVLGHLDAQKPSDSRFFSRFRSRKSSNQRDLTLKS